MPSAKRRRDQSARRRGKRSMAVTRPISGEVDPSAPRQNATVLVGRKLIDIEIMYLGPLPYRPFDGVSRPDDDRKWQRRVLLGEITGVHGIRGDVLVRSYTRTRSDRVLRTVDRRRRHPAASRFASSASRTKASSPTSRTSTIATPPKHFAEPSSTSNAR